MHLDQLAVRPERMRQGIGGRLVAAVIDHARACGAPGVTLTTFRDVPWNGPWYARHGFSVLPESAWGGPSCGRWSRMSGTWASNSRPAS
ncbi:GNAT family N-acetyltransferase [Nonomuraea salmonea]|uniref:GNAT family N-acetyltransferase n=1 Tax=Nonomuraea salmonea TaxID=46181 RepID=UPI002FE8103C